MRRAALTAAAVAVLLLLAGCTNGTATTSGNVDSSTTSSEQATTPLTAESPSTAAARGETAFLEEVRAELRPDNVIPNATDAQLLDAGAKACEGIAAGADTLTLSLIDGEPTNGMGYYTDSGVIITAARGTLCD